MAASMSRDEALPGKESSSFVLEKESLSVTLLVHPDYTAISYLPVFAKDLPLHAISCQTLPASKPQFPTVQTSIRGAVSSLQAPVWDYAPSDQARLVCTFGTYKGLGQRLYRETQRKKLHLPSKYMNISQDILKGYRNCMVFQLS